MPDVQLIVPDTPSPTSNNEAPIDNNMITTLVNDNPEEERKNCMNFI